MNEQLAQGIRTHFREKCNDELLSMALLPEGTALIHSDKKTFPAFQFKNIFILPGLPAYFREKFLVDYACNNCNQKRAKHLCQ